MNFWPFKKKKKPAPVPTPAATPNPEESITAPPPPLADAASSAAEVAAEVPKAESPATPPPLPTAGEASSAPAAEAEATSSPPAETSEPAVAEAAPATATAVDGPPAETAPPSAATETRKPAFTPPVLAPEPPKYGPPGAQPVTPPAPPQDITSRKFTPKLAPEPPPVTALDGILAAPPALPAFPSINEVAPAPVPEAASKSLEASDVIEPQQPVAEQPVAEQPVAEQPVAEQPVAEQPVAEQPVAEQPVAEQPVAEQPVAEQPVAEQPVAEQPVAEQPVAAATPESEPVQSADPTFSTPVSVDGFTLHDDGTWSFDASHPAYQHLQLGVPPLTLTIPIVASHSADGDVASQTLVICLQGTVSAPVIGGVTQVVRYEGDSRVSGHFVNIEGTGGDAELGYFTSTQAPGFTLNADGSYILDPADPAYGHLTPGECQIYAIPVALADAGGVLDTKELVICIAGTSGEPAVASVSAHDARGSGSILRGQLSPGSGTTSVVCQTSSVVPGFTLNSKGAWIFASSHPAYDDLKAGAVRTITIPVTVSSGEAATAEARAISITLQGTSAAPALSAVVADADPEGRSVQGALGAHGGESADFFTYAYINTLPTGFNLGIDGTWSFEASTAGYGHLAPGYTENVVVNVRAEDSGGNIESSTVTITIHGAASGPALGSVVISTHPGESEAYEPEAASGPADEYEYLFDDNPHPGNLDELPEGYNGGPLTYEGETAPDAPESLLLDDPEGPQDSSSEVKDALQNLGFAPPDHETTHGTPQRESLRQH
ncbi:MAG: VCBS domain-containing protein [Verrucomicrobium sp.]